MNIFIISTIGILTGSFLNVCIYRIPKKQSISYPPSHCPKCDTKLKPLDLIPVLSYLFLKGKCRYCGEKISPRYPIVELFNALLYLLFYYKYGLSFMFIKYAFLSSFLIVVSFIDLELQIIPDRLIAFALIVGVVFNIIYEFKLSLLNGILGLIIGGGLFLLIAIVTRGAMGGGDIKLMGVLGFVLGWRYILMITLLSFIIGAFISIFLLAFKVKGRKDFIPFGPFISIAAFITMLYGNEILFWYFNNMVR